MSICNLQMDIFYKALSSGEGWEGFMPRYCK
ncbi:MAG: hypothetical protein JWR38_420 [Mucilaginibacter sp.]|nr:hypothetical protein [Mucilaginibacter sp.]